MLERPVLRASLRAQRCAALMALALRAGKEPETRTEGPAVLEQLKALGYVVDEE